MERTNTNTQESTALRELAESMFELYVNTTNRQDEPFPKYVRTTAKAALVSAGYSLHGRRLTRCCLCGMDFEVGEKEHLMGDSPCCETCWDSAPDSRK